MELGTKIYLQKETWIKMITPITFLVSGPVGNANRDFFTRTRVGRANRNKNAETEESERRFVHLDNEHIMKSGSKRKPLS